MSFAYFNCYHRPVHLLMIRLIKIVTGLILDYTQKRDDVTQMRFADCS